MKISDYKIGNIYSNNGKSTMLNLSSFNRILVHYYATKECLFDAIPIDSMKLKALGFIQLVNENEFLITFDNRYNFTLEKREHEFYSIWLNGKHLLRVQFIHELQDIIRIFSKHELELK